jgi:hypothetical protein
MSQKKPNISPFLYSKVNLKRIRRRELKKPGTSDLPDNKDDVKSTEETEVREVGYGQLYRTLSRRHLVRDSVHTKIGCD